MKRVYLDFWVWVSLAKAGLLKQEGSQFANAFDLVGYAADHGLASFPLSSAHYSELLHVKNPRQRYEVGQLMYDVSKGHRMIGLTDRVFRAELDVALRKRFSVQIRPRHVDVFGSGYNHVLDLPRVRARIERKDGGKLTDVDLGWISDLEEIATDDLERMLLCEPPEGVDVPGYDANADRVLAERFAEEEKEQALRFQQFGTSVNRQGRVLLAQEWIRNLHLFVDSLARCGIDPARFLQSQNGESRTALVRDMPVVWAALEMRRLQHQNPQRRWKTNDYYDVTALSVAVVHCDVVVTERHWAALIRRAGLDKLHSTVLWTQVNDLLRLPGVQ